MIHVVPGRKNPKIILEGNEYELNRKSQGMTFWNCVFYRTTKCQAKAVTFGNKLRKNNNHNHHPRTRKYKVSPTALNVTILE